MAKLQSFNNYLMKRYTKRNIIRTIDAHFPNSPYCNILDSLRLDKHRLGFDQPPSAAQFRGAHAHCSLRLVFLAAGNES